MTKSLLKEICGLKVLYYKYIKIKTPIHVEKEVEMGIIKKPIFLKKLTLNNTFKKTIKEEI